MHSKTIKFILSLTMMVFFLGGCSSGGGTTSTTTTSLSGVAQKGAFLKDSTVSLCKLDDKLVCTSDKLEIKVSDNKGSYEFKTLPWSGLSRLTISGYYLDELTGVKSLSPATITAIIDIKSKVKQKSNTNLLTDLRAKRMKKLVDEGKSKEDADKESKEDIKTLFNVSSDDFTELDIVDFSAGKASVNAELLRLSAAIAKSSNPVADLEKLMEIYNEGGLSAVLESRLYKKLMGDADEVDVKDTLLTMGVRSDVVNDIPLSDISISPFARVSMSTTNSSQVFLTLFGTEVNSATPNINLSVEGGDLSFSINSISDDNRTIVLDMNESSSCKDINITFVVEYDSLVGVDALPLQTNKMRYIDPMTICSQGGETGVPITVPDNQLPVAVIGMEYSDAEINVVNITAYVGQRVPGLETSYSYDRDPYPFGGITHCKFEDNNSEILKEENHASCDLYNHVINEAGVYDYTLTVTDKTGATDTSVAHITVLANTAPQVAIDPATNQSISVGDTLELNATAIDADAGDTLTLQWRYQKIGTPTQYGAGSSEEFSHTFNEAGDYNISVTVRDSQNAEAVAYTMVSVNAIVVPVNHAPTVSISPNGDKDIHVGDSVILKSLAADEDSDDLTISWKIKESTASTFTAVPLYGATGFQYTFDALGTYLVVVEAEDGSGAKADANITVRVTQAPAVTLSLPDINTSIVVKGQDSFPDQGQSGVAATLETAPKHGTVEFYLVGNENPYINYTSTDCFVGKDSFIYKSGDDYGRVNVTITAPSSLEAPNISKTLYNTETISSVYLTSNKSATITTSTTGGSSSLVIVGGEAVHYSYDPDDTFIGNDFFEYTVNDTINECPYSATGRVDFNVQEYVAQKKVISTCRDPYSIGTEPYTTEGTLESTVLLKDLRPGRSSGKAVSTGFNLFDDYKKIEDIQYFSAFYTAGGIVGYELYETNETAEGTFVHDINTHNEFSGHYLYGSSHPGSFVRIDDNLFFIASDSTFDRYGMYKADGTTVQRIADVASTPIKLNGEYYYFSSVEDNVTLNKFSADFSSSTLMSSFTKEVSGRDTKILTTVNDKILYTEYIDSSISYALYAKTVTGESVKLTDDEIHMFHYVRLNGKIYMLAQEYGNNSTTKIIETDGTLEGTKVLYTFDGGIDTLATLNGKLYFKGYKSVDDDGVSKLDKNLYELDLSNPNVSLIADITYGDSDDIGEHAGMDGMSVVNGKLIYESVNLEIVDGKTHAYELLWASDGTSEGTVAILRRDRSSVKSQQDDLRDIFELNGSYYFQDNLGRLYKTDFTEAGTSLVLDYICDIIPDSFSFENVTDAELNTYYEANMTVEGITYPQTKLSIEGGEYSLDDGLSWHTEATTIANGQKIKVRHMSSDKYDTSVETTLYVGQDYETFSSRTKTETLATPNQFTFADVTNVNVNTIQIADITVTGINVEVPLSITGGEYSLDSGSSWSIADVNVTNNQVVYVRHTSSASNETQVDTVLTVGGVSDTFSSTTRAANTSKDTVTVGDLMWEDTDHVRGTINYVTWSQAQNYCSSLELEGYTNWRLPHSNMNSDNPSSEIRTIRVEASADSDNTILEDFNPVYQSDRITTWTDELVDTGSYVAMIFQYGTGNGDAFSESSNDVNVRCVRDAQ